MDEKKISTNVNKNLISNKVNAKVSKNRVDSNSIKKVPTNAIRIYKRNIDRKNSRANAENNSSTVFNNTINVDESIHVSNINTNASTEDNNSTISQNFSRIRTSSAPTNRKIGHKDYLSNSSSNPKIKTMVSKGQIKHLQTGKIGVLNSVKTNDATDNMGINTIVNSIETKDAVVDKSKSLIHAYKQIKKTSKSVKNVLSKDTKIEDKIKSKEILTTNIKSSIKNVGKDAIKGSLNNITTEDKTDNLSVNSVQYSIEKGKKISSGAKKVINKAISVSNIVQKHKQKSKIRTSYKKEIKTATEQSSRILTKQYVKKLGENNPFKQKAKLEQAKKIFDNFVNIKNIVLQVFKSKGTTVVLGGTAIFLCLIMMVTSMAALCSTMSTTPNISNPQEWIDMMNKIDSETNSKLKSGNKLEVKNVDKQADWKAVIAVAMAKYDNDPPAFNESPSNNNTNPETGEVDSTTQTTFTGTYQDIINVAASANGVDPCLIAAIIKQESDFNPLDTSPVGAMGLMQLMPETAAEYGCLNGYDPYQNVMAGSKLIAELLQRYNGDLTLALAGYNAGSGNVDKYGGVPPFAETQQYVVKVQAYYQAYTSGQPLPDGEITGVVAGGMNGGTNNFLSQIYNAFNEVTRRTEKHTTTKTDSDGNTVTNTKTVVIYTLTFHDIDYAMDKLGLDNSQKDVAKAMLEADTFADIIENFDFKFKLNVPSSNGSIDIGSSSSEALSPDNIQTTSQTRRALIETANQLVGRVKYFWGGKSGSGWNDMWGQDAIVTATGSPSTGTTRPYGLDCSGFVGWVYETAGITNQLQGSTFTERDASYQIEQSEAKPGDLVFYADYSHVGLFAGRDESGQDIYIECCSSKGVCVTYGTERNFTIYRRPYIDFEEDE